MSAVQALYYKFIPQPPHGYNILRGLGVIFNFISQMVDMHHNGIVVHFPVAPDLLVQLFLRENLSDMLQEEGDHHGFFGRKRDFLPVLP